MSFLRIVKAAVCCLLLSALLASCGFVSDGPSGWAVNNIKLPVAKGPAASGYKEGLACIYAAFGMISLGDASIESAMRSGGIKEIYTIDTTAQSFFGFYTRQCTVIVGN
ncbi:TRL-like family protein [Candidatus Magnetomonas plexicatena]|uniref:TRL-like family protein n=1 Tax=Candidatus Magnetomonas plexicatena TaxID=2552947 RepID=UPI001C78DE47|nr:hypothetical protein E2O03_010355 [Nitrospirales bacterium LBB_01]